MLFVSYSGGREKTKEGPERFRALFSEVFWIWSSWIRPASAIETMSWSFTSSMLRRVWMLRKFFRQKAYSFVFGLLRVRFHAVYAL